MALSELEYGTLCRWQVLCWLWMEKREEARKNLNYLSTDTEWVTGLGVSDPSPRSAVGWSHSSGATDLTQGVFA